MRVRRIVVGAATAGAAGLAVALAVVLGPEARTPSDTPEVREGGREGAAPSGRASSGLAYPLARLVPDDAVAFVSVPDFPRFSEGMASTGMGRALGDREFEAFVGRLAESLPPDLAAVCASGGAAWELLRPALGAEVAFAVTRAEPVARAAGGTGPRGTPGRAPRIGLRIDAAFMADVSGREKEARRLLGAIQPLLFAGGGIRPAEVAGRDAFVCADERGREILAWSMGEGLLAAATSRAALAPILERLGGLESGAGPGRGGDRAPPSLQTSLAYASAKAGCTLGGTFDYAVFVRGEGVRRLLRVARVRPGNSWFEAGLAELASGLDFAALAGRFDADPGRGEDGGAVFREALFLAGPALVRPGAGSESAALRRAQDGDTEPVEGVAAEPGLFTRLLTGGEVDAASASRLPSGTLFAAFARPDGPGLARDLARGVAGVAGDLPVDALETALAHLAARGGEAALGLWNSGKVGWFPRAALVADAPDKGATDAAVEQALALVWRSFASSLRGELRSRRVPLALPANGPRASADAGQATAPVGAARTVEMHYVDRPAFFLPVVGSPAYALVPGASGGPDGGMVVAGTSATAVRAVLAEGAGLGANADFRAVLDALPEQRSFLVYADVATLAWRAWEPYAPVLFARALPAGSRRLDRGEFPFGRRVARELGPAGVSVRETPGGLRADAVSPVGLPLALAVAVFLAR